MQCFQILDIRLEILLKYSDVSVIYMENCILALFMCVFNIGGEPSYHLRHSNRYWVHYGACKTCCVSSIQDGALNLSFAESNTCSY
jgi:hypothetical protein